MKKYRTISSKELWLIPPLLLLIALLSLPYAYYQLLRWVICGCAAYIAHQSYQEKEWNWVAIIFIGFAILYNPISAIHLPKDTWGIINITTAVAFIYVWLGLKQNKE